MVKDLRENANKNVKKAERLFELGYYKKAGKSYLAAGNIFLKIQEFILARDCFDNSAISYSKEEKYYFLIEALRGAGNASLYLNNINKANQFFKSAIKYISQLKKVSERDQLYIIFSSLSCLCLFIKGKQDQGLDTIKNIKNLINPLYFKESSLIKLVKNLTIAIRDKKKKYLEKIEEEFEEYKFREAEESLVKKNLVLAMAHNSLILKLNLDKEKYSTNEIIQLTLMIDSKPLLKISKYSFYDYNIEELRITNIGITLSDNLLIDKKPNLPILLKPGDQKKAIFKIKSHFQVDNPFIGPLSLTCEIDNNFLFILKTESIIPKLISPPATINISYKNLRTPLINQTFPMEIKIENNGRGEASNIEIEIEFPKQLKIMRGTSKKQIYMLGTNENMKWEVSIKPLEAGDYEIIFKIKFQDADQNSIEEIQKFPFSIKL